MKKKVIKNTSGANAEAQIYEGIDHCVYHKLRETDK